MTPAIALLTLAGILLVSGFKNKSIASTVLGTEERKADGNVTRPSASVAARVDNIIGTATGIYPLAKIGSLIGRPHQGTHNLGNWQSDNAVDLSVPRGTPVLAMESGTVTKVVKRADGGGRFAGSQVTVKGDSGQGYFYAHLAGVNVRQGQKVGQAHQIGTSGVANGSPHLHLGFEHGDPLEFIKR